ncbi:Hypothetical protein CINCED_3A010634 [Cinara cedri]|uniref:Uncharacterized protein n=1 Tax=Cinara cedri TaxID=506608 RepID=A0A5E4NLP1_9HEMI|nr:Hypothetical protein CINCED_3A010634 [Cinara cedri]
MEQLSTLLEELKNENQLLRDEVDILKGKVSWLESLDSSSLISFVVAQSSSFTLTTTLHPENAAVELCEFGRFDDEFSVTTSGDVGNEAEKKLNDEIEKQKAFEPITKGLKNVEEAVRKTNDDIKSFLISVKPLTQASDFITKQQNMIRDRLRNRILKFNY